MKKLFEFLLFFTIIIGLMACSELDAPQNLTINNDLLTWDAVESAEEYIVILGNLVIPLKENSLDLVDYIDLLEPGILSIQVVWRIGQVESKSASINYNVNIQAPKNVTISSRSIGVGTEIRWEPVLGAVSYVVVFDNTLEIEATKNTLTLQYRLDVKDNTVLMNTKDIRIISIDVEGNRSSKSDNAQLLEALEPLTINYKSGPLSEIQWSDKSKALYYTITVGEKKVITDNNSIRIGDLDLSPGRHVFYVTEHYLGYSSLPSNNINLLWGYDIELPELPIRVCSKCSDEKQVYEITSISYNYAGLAGVDFFFSGKLLESMEASNSSVTGNIRFNILQTRKSQVEQNATADYVVSQLNFDITSLLLGDEFTNIKTTWYPYGKEISYGSYILSIELNQN